MYKIVFKRQLNDQIHLMQIDAPLIARKAEAGQFIILRTHDGGERIPLTITDCDAEKGLVTIIFQIVGKTTAHLATLPQGGVLQDFVGPLGLPTELAGNQRAIVIGGGLGVAIAYPQAKKLAELGADLEVVLGFRNRDLIILHDEFAALTPNLHICTDDGSNGRKGFVTNVLQELLTQNPTCGLVSAIGPLPMMRAVSEVTRPNNIKTIVSMNPIMIDGTGMCGCCRVTVGGQTKFACVDGPDFDGHQVDFEEAIFRQNIYKDAEKTSYDLHKCRLLDAKPQ